MIILPAIDIKDGECVRLYQGDYAQVTTYDTDPVRVAQRWQREGAQWLHVVDLDGAAQGHPVNSALIRQMCMMTSLHIEVGGGMRTLTDIEQVLALGVERVILGTVALKDRTLLQNALAQWGERIVVGLDARNGLVAVDGWRETSRVQATHLATELSALGVQRFIYTDIARDGVLGGPNLQALGEMQRATARALIASGGVSTLKDVSALAAMQVEGAIIGKALYTADIALAQAIAAVGRK